jgi:hypothetical protein
VATFLGHQDKMFSNRQKIALKNVFWLKIDKVAVFDKKFQCKNLDY